MTTRERGGGRTQSWRCGADQPVCRRRAARPESSRWNWVSGTSALVGEGAASPLLGAGSPLGESGLRFPRRLPSSTGRFVNRSQRPVGARLQPRCWTRSRHAPRTPRHAFGARRTPQGSGPRRVPFPDVSLRASLTFARRGVDLDSSLMAVGRRHAGIRLIKTRWLSGVSPDPSGTLR